MTNDNTAGINFWMQNVMNISDATRKNKLAEILDSYADSKKSTVVYIIQNSKKKEAAGVISSVNYHLDLEQSVRKLEDEVLRLTDEVLRLEAQLRIEQPVYSLSEALERLELSQDDLNDIFENSDEVEID